MLRYLTHLLGDVYQPLHAGYLDDKGGNKYQLQAFKKGSNLHALWDSGMIKKMNEDVEAMTARLLKLKVPFTVQNGVQFVRQSSLVRLWECPGSTRSSE